MGSKAQGCIHKFFFKPMNEGIIILNDSIPVDSAIVSDSTENIIDSIGSDFEIPAELQNSEEVSMSESRVFHIH